MNAGLNQYLCAMGFRNAKWEKCKQLGGEIARRGVPVAIRLATAGIFGDKGLAGDVALSAAGSAAEDAVKAYEFTRTKITKFKELLSQVLEHITNERPLVIFVDELDRCRPTYAIELLERIKHLFDQNGVVFVLSMDKGQLCHSIGAVYGSIDAAGYLRRFIDLEYVLPNPSPDAYLDKLFVSFGLEKFFQARGIDRKYKNERDYLYGAFKALCASYDLALREIEQFLSRICLALYATPKDEHCYPPLVAFLVLLSEKNPEMYATIVDGTAPVREVLGYIRNLSKRGASEQALYSMAVTEGYIVLALTTGEELHRFYESYHKTVDGGGANREARDQARAAYNVIYEHLNFSHGSPKTNILKRVQLTSNFELSHFDE